MRHRASQVTAFCLVYYLGGFWMHSRGDSVTTFTAENAADQFGVIMTSYEAVPLPKIRCVHSFFLFRWTFHGF